MKLGRIGIALLGALLLAGAYFVGGWLGGLLYTPMGQIIFWEFLVFGAVVLAFLAMIVIGIIAIAKGLLG